MNVAMVLEMAAQGYGPRGAIVTADGDELSYAELLARVRRRAATLREEATRAGAAHVAYIGLSGQDFVEHLLAAGWAGLTFLPLNYRTRAEELAPLLDPFRPLVVVHAGYEDKARLCLADGDVLISAATPAATAPLEVCADDPDEVAFVLFTSGTTSRPKAVLLRHRHLCAYIFGTVDFGSSAAEETALVCVPPYHIAGIMGALTPLYSGRRMAFLAQFDAVAWLEAAQGFGVTHAFVVPTMLGRILDALDADPALHPAALRHLAYGGGPIHRVVVERALARLPAVDFVNAYGLTETSSTVCLLGPEDHREAVAATDPAIRARLGSVGRSLPGVEIRIIGEDGCDVPAGEVGVITITGPQVSAHYHGRDAPAGRFATGDLGYLDAGGYLFIGGRSDDVIIRGGENISPVEIEEVLARHPTVAAAAVVGVPDEEWGQRVVAFLEPRGPERADPEELTAWARRSLAGFKVPESFHFVQELPRTDTGKVLRTRLRGDHLDGVGTAG